MHRFGPYELLEEIGRGGMGVIYKARQPGLDRIVALKMLLAGEFADAHARERLLREARIASRLTHPGIVTIHEVGEHQGRPYFAMEYVPGRNLSQQCRDGLLPLSTAVRYVEQVARSVHYAHQHGVIHRDLKPANVLISPEDEPKLTDFGLTKSLVDPTQTLGSAGSPNFMAPEQADSSLGTTGTPTDIFGLGAILYFLLTGRPPAIGETLGETVRNVVAGEPLPPRQLRPAVPIDLETVTLKCLEKEPARRYATALDVADELACWQRHEPIAARPSTPTERLAKWVRRRPMVAALGLSCSLVFFLGFAGITWQWRRAERQSEETARANYAAALGLVQERLDEGNFLAARRQLYELPDRFRGWEWGRLLRLAHREVLSSPILHQDWDGPLAPAHFPRTTLGVTSSADHRWLACWGSGRFEILAVSNQASVLRLGSRAATIHGAAFSPSGSHLAIVGSAMGVELRRCADWQTVGQWQSNGPAPLSVQFSPDGRRLVTSDGSDALQIITLGDGPAPHVLRGPLPPYHHARFTSDGKWIIGQQQRPREASRFTIWDAGTGTLHASVPATTDEFRSVELAEDGILYATVDTRGVAAVWRVGGSRPEFQTPAEGDEIVWAAVAVDSPRLVTFAERSRQARFWNLQTGQPLPTSRVEFGNPQVSSDGRTLVSCANALVHRWSWETGQPEETLGIVDVAFQSRTHVSPDGRLLIALAGHNPIPSMVHAWVLPGPDLRLSPPNPAHRAAISPDGTRIALAHIDSRITLRDARSGAQAGALHGHFRPVTDLAWTADGQHLFSAGRDHTVRRWDVARQTQTLTLTNLSQPIWSLSTTPDGRRVAASDTTGRVALWDGGSGRLLHQWTLGKPGTLLPVGRVRLSPDGREIVITGFPEAGVWSTETGQRIAQFNPPGSSPELDPEGCTFTADGLRLATVDRSGRLRIWDRRRWTVTHTDRASTGALEVAFSADGARLFLTVCQAVSTSRGMVEVEVHDGWTGAPLLSLGRSQGWGTAIAPLPDGRRLLHTVLNDANPTHGTDLLEALPWRESDYPTVSGSPLGARILAASRAGELARLRQPSFASPRPTPLPREPRSNWSPRPESLPPSAIDLTEAYNGHLETGWCPADSYEPGNSLAALPTGHVQLDGIDWDIRGVVTTGPENASPLHPWPAGRIVRDIPVQADSRRLHFLHACDESSRGTGLVGRYRIHFDDGTSTDLVLELGEDIGEWWSTRPQSECRKGRLAWEGSNPAADLWGSRIRLFHRAWDNPRPGHRIASIDLIAEGNSANPFLVALSVER